MIGLRMGHKMKDDHTILLQDKMNHFVAAPPGTTYYEIV